MGPDVLAAAAPSGIELPTLTTHEMILRIVLAGVFGAIVGFEREWRDRTAGLRTHMLVCIGSAVFTVISAYGFHEWWQVVGASQRPNVIMDPARIAAQIVSGIGFLGAGAIFQSRGSVKGLTTAGSLWAMAAIGMAVGAGMYLVAGVSTATIVVVLAMLRQTSHRIRRAHQTDKAELQLQVVQDDAYPRLLDALSALGTSVTALTAERVKTGSSERRLWIEISVPHPVTVPQVVGQLLAIDGIDTVTVDDIPDDSD